MTAALKPPSVLFVHAGAELYGADRILLELTAGLRDRGHALHVVLPGPGPLHAELAQIAVPSHRRNLGVLRRRYFTPLGLLNRACRLATATRYLVRLIRTHDIAVVHSNTTAVIAGALAARWADVPHVWHVHEITTRPRWFATAIARLVGLLSNRVAFVSAATRDHLCAMDARVRANAVVIHNGIDPARVSAGQPGVLRGELGWSAQHVVVGMIGRVNWWKGQLTLFDCAARLVERDASLRFVMVGGTYDGDNRVMEQLTGAIAAQGLGEVVRVCDFRSDVGNVLADLDVFVLPSTEPDPFPTVVLEAMAAARPVVAFRHGGVCEMVEEGVTGLLCAPCSVDAMAAAILRLAGDPETRRRMGADGRQRLEQLFTRAAFIDRFADLYRELAGRKGPVA